MRLAFLKTSLIDFPGRVASVAFLPGCNLRCPYCHNAELVTGSGGTGMVDWAAVLKHLERRRGLVTGLVFSGGEPCLRAELTAMAREARGLGAALKLDTNGTLPSAIAPVGADYVAMDLKTTLPRYAELARGGPLDARGSDLAMAERMAESIAESMDLVRSLGCGYEFRITCAPGIFGEAEALAVLPLLSARDSVWLQAWRPGPCLDEGWAAGVREYTPAELDALLSIVRRAVPGARLRGR